MSCNIKSAPWFLHYLPEIKGLEQFVKNMDISDLIDVGLMPSRSEHRWLTSQSAQHRQVLIGETPTCKIVRYGSRVGVPQDRTAQHPCPLPSLPTQVLARSRNRRLKTECGSFYNRCVHWGLLHHHGIWSFGRSPPLFQDCSALIPIFFAPRGPP